MIATVALVLCVYVLSIVALPWPSWPAIGCVARALLCARGLTLRTRLSMLGYLGREIATLPVQAAFWWADELFARGYRDAPLEPPLFIVGQPRSGTTFLLRTLGRDAERFVSAQHLEWRYPSIVFWRLIERLGLRDRLERRSYWPRTPLGELCERVHAHTLGVHEELGIFLEEKFFRHYFTFRRFPFPEVLRRCADHERLERAERERLARTIERVMRKVLYHRGGSARIFVTKENETVALHEILLERFPDARFVFLGRRAEDFLASYRTMSEVCTEVKHGLDPHALDGWDEANMDFRLEECRRYTRFVARVLDAPRARAIALRYEDLVADIPGSVARIYRALELPLGARFAEELEALQVAQRGRRRGYDNAPYSDARFAFWNRFVASLVGPARAPASPSADLTETKREAA